MECKHRASENRTTVRHGRHNGCHHFDADAKKMALEHQDITTTRLYHELPQRQSQTCALSEPTSFVHPLSENASVPTPITSLQNSEPNLRDCCSKVTRFSTMFSNVHVSYNDCRHQSTTCVLRSRHSSSLCFWASCLMLLFCIVLPATPVSAQGCVEPLDSKTVEETAAAGTQILNISSVGVTWRFVLEDNPQLTDYLEMTQPPGLDLYVLTLTKPLDLEELYKINNVTLNFFVITLYCKELNQPEPKYSTVVLIQEVNEFAPEFIETDIYLSIPETHALLTPFISLIDWAEDKDVYSAVREIREFNMFQLTIDYENDGTRELSMENRTYNGDVYLKSPLDYDTLPTGRKFVAVGVTVTDRGGLSGTATLIVNVEDSDDLPPYFYYDGCPEPCSDISYTVEVDPSTTGAVSDVQPSPIWAKDGDALGYIITYHIIQGPSGYENYIRMDQGTGQLSIIKALEESNYAQLVLIIEAREISTLARSTKTSLFVSIAGGSSDEGGASGGNETGPGPVASASKESDDILIVAIVLAVIFFVVVVVLCITMIYFRKRYKKVVHPDPRQGQDDQTEGTVNNAARTDASGGGLMRERPPTLIMSDNEPLRTEEELITWVPLTPSKDIVDLSDEDTMKWKKKNGAPPANTKLTNRDSAFEDSDKKSGSDESQKWTEPYPETEYTEVGSPLSERKDYKEAFEKFTDSQPLNKDASMADSGLDEAEYATPVSVAHKQSRRPVKDNTALQKNGDNTAEPQTQPLPESFRGDAARPNVDEPAAAGLMSFSQTHDTSSLPSPSGDGNDAEDEETEYCIPRSSREIIRRRFSVPETVEESGGETNAVPSSPPGPAVPPRTTVHAVSGLRTRRRGSQEHGQQRGSASVDGPELPNNGGHGGEHGEKPIQPPARKKRPRKRSKVPRAPEEDVYDGTKDYEDLEMDSGFYTDTKKVRIKRSTRLPVMRPDPNDTRYWITVTND